MEGGSLAFLALRPDFTTMPLHNAMRNRQPHSFPFRLPGMKALKDLKELGLAVLRNPQAVITHPVVDHPFFHLAAHLDLERAIRTPVLDAVADQVGKDLPRAVASAVTEGNSSTSTSAPASMIACW